MSYYTHLSTKELTFIEDYYELGHSGRSIAKKMRRSPETISRVIRKLQTGLNAPQIYDKYMENKKLCGRKKIDLSRVDKEHIESKVKLGWTPDVIVGRGEQVLPCCATTLYRRFKEGVFDIKLLPMQGKKSRMVTKKNAGNSHLQEIFAPEKWSIPTIIQNLDT